MLDPAALSATLQALSDPEKKDWWERYLKGAIEFYGVPMATIRQAVHAWCGAAPDPAELRRAALELLEQPVAEQKLAGILVMQELLLPAGDLTAGRDLAPLAQCFDRGHIADWNTTDWLCVRVLGPLILREGRPAGDILAGWTDAPSMWRRRAAAVSFVPVVLAGTESVSWLIETVLGVCGRLVGEDARFIQTAIGWVLRDVSNDSPDRVAEFLTAHQSELSRESLRMAAARLSDEQRSALGITGKRRRR